MTDFERLPLELISCHSLTQMTLVHKLERDDFRFLVLPILRINLALSGKLNMSEDTMSSCAQTAHWLNTYVYTNARSGHPRSRSELLAQFHGYTEQLGVYLSDCLRAETDADIDAERYEPTIRHFKSSLWIDEPEACRSETLSKHSGSKSFVSKLGEAGSEFDFWIEWFTNLQVGINLEQPLAKEIVGIDSKTWMEKGAPAKIAEAIREIEAKHHLLTAIADLRAQMEEMRRSVQAPAQGHNQGPPLDDVAATQIPRQFELVWPILDGLEEEAGKESPDLARLRALALSLWKIAQKIAFYCGEKLDLALDKAVETLSVTGTKVAIGVYATHALASNSGVQSVAKAAWAYAQKLAGG